jgi:16S rRNA (cytosine1402-N4)-methyltransferase
MSNEDPKPARRIRYAGTHPKTFKAKYKELQPEAFATDVQKIMAQGKTPAGMHRSIAVQEILDILQIQPGQIGLDATLGYGGHSVEMLKQLNFTGKLFATDVDPIELPKTQARLEALGYTEQYLGIRKMNFASINAIVQEAGLLHFVLADLGLSSMQIDNPDRGFTFKVNCPLDLRLNPNKGQSAAQFLASINQQDVENVLIDNADEPNAAAIAAAIIHFQTKQKNIETTFELKQVISQAVSKMRLTDTEIKKTCQRCFQAIRIAVNKEFDVLEQFLDRLPYCMASGGRIAIMSFHSGEDRRVKKSFQKYFRDEQYSQIATEIVRASAKECFDNPRAKSAKIRWAIKA